MSIVSSTYTLHPQVDGRNWVTEDHVDQLGGHWPYEYLAPNTTNYDALLATHAAEVWNMIVTSEIINALRLPVAPVLKYATGAEAVAMFKLLFSTSSQMVSGQMADWLLSRIADGSYTAVQLQGAFGYTSNYWDNTYYPMLVSYQAAYNTMTNARGQ